ncbi:MAG TPA: hypothetical protein GX726_05425 [Clostridiales bacterium]|nr:hypothetical protein [Clostridiales bacterium]
MGLSFAVYGVLAALIAVGCLLLHRQYTRTLWEKALRWRQNIPPPRPLFEALAERIGVIFGYTAKDKIDFEIYEAISYLRNVCALTVGAALTSDRILEQLTVQADRLKPIFAGMLRLIRQNQREEAVRLFTEATDRGTAADFARLLVQWDEIEPHILSETLVSHQKSYREMRQTVQKRRDELISDLIYLPVVLNVMLLFINFIYVGYFIDQRALLDLMF